MKKVIIIAAITLGLASCGGAAEEATVATDSTAVVVDTNACATPTVCADTTKCDTIK